MKKLNKTELEALSSRINHELRQQAEVAQIKCDKETLPGRVIAAGLIVKEWSHLSNKTKEYLSNKFQHNSKEPTVDNVMKSLVTDQTKIITSNRWDRNIYESLVLAQIEANTVADLISAVKKEFVKE